MPERIMKVIELLDLVEVRRLQNHKLIAAAIDSLRAIANDLQAQTKQEEKPDEV